MRIRSTRETAGEVAICQVSRVGRRGVLLGGLAASLSACAPRLDHLAGTPAAPFMAGGFASVHEQADGMGGPLGAAVALDDRHVLTCAHVLPSASANAWLRRPDGAADHGRVLARSPGLDLMVLSVTPGFLRPATFADQAPVAGQAVWALGAPGIGPTLAAGQVDHVEAVLQGTGPGFTARMPALMGYSGGPMIDAWGRVLGLTAAMLRPASGGGAMLLARLSGMDLAGLTRGQDRRVFALSAAAVRAEAARLLG